MPLDTTSRRLNCPGGPNPTLLFAFKAEYVCKACRRKCPHASHLLLVNQRRSWRSKRQGCLALCRNGKSVVFLDPVDPVALGSVIRAGVYKESVPFPCGCIGHKVPLSQVRDVPYQWKHDSPKQLDDSDEAVAKRDHIIFGVRVEEIARHFGIHKFNAVGEHWKETPYLTAAKIDQLDRLDVLDLDLRKHDSPTIRQFRDFIAVWPQVGAVGFVKSYPYKEVCVDGIECFDGITPELKRAFKKFVKPFKPDEFINGRKRLWAWWD